MIDAVASGEEENTVAEGGTRDRSVGAVDGSARRAAADVVKVRSPVRWRMWLELLAGLAVFTLVWTANCGD